MYNNILVHSRSEMEVLSRELTEPYILVSISDVNQPMPDIDYGPETPCQAARFLFFDDEEGGPNAMKEEDAHEILEMTKLMCDYDLDIHVHCGAGVSRSAGVAASLQLLWWGDDSQIFGDGKYAPNMHCYRMMLNCAGFGYEESELADKEARNYELWRLVHADDFD